MPVSKVLLSHERSIFHKQLLDTILSVDAGGIPSNADRSNKLSVQLAQGIHQRILQEVTLHADIAQEQPTTYMKRQKAQGQTSGSIFEEKTMEFLRSTIPKLQHIRPGNWHILKLGNKNAIKTSDFAQYEHLAYLNALVKRDSHLSAALGNDYMVAPDIIVYRDLYTDEELNTPEAIVDDHTAKSAAIRKINGGKPILHASVSAKWTMRSDRAQNSRTEALNLIRNRKGSLPHIVVVTGEPTPSRLASLALGTGDIDCLYHFALYELVDTVNELAAETPAAEDTQQLLQTLIEEKRLKDISDLPLDLGV